MMEQQGAVSMEMLISFSIFIFVLVAATGVALGVGESFNEKANVLEAKTNAEECAVVFDSIYANRGGQLDGGAKFKCNVEKGKTISTVDGQSAASEMINNSTENRGGIRYVHHKEQYLQ